MRTSLAFVFALCLAPPALAQKEFGFDNRKPSGQPYWKAEETVAKFKVPDEFEVKLFAGEPQVVNPVAFTIDEKGRIWVVECFEYPKRTPKGKAPRDRIVILEDTDGDGVCDKRTVFAEGKDFPVPEERTKAGLGAFDLCTGIEVGHGGVFVGAAPYLWFIENKNDKAGKFEVLLKGFGSQDTHETLNTFQWGPDGWLYGLHGIFTNSEVAVVKDPTPQPPPRSGEGEKAPPSLEGKGAGGLGSPARINGGIWRYHPTKKKFEIFAEGTSNPWGMDWRNTDGQFILACCVIPHLYHIVPGGIYKRQAGASYNPHVYSYLNEICDHSFHKESGWAHAGLISLDVPHMPKRFQNSVIFGSIHGCSIKQNILKPNGSTYTASRGDDFLVSGDKNFRPINMKWGPLGDIYLIDWHDQNPCHQTNPDDWDYEHGRVYRIQLKGTKTKKAEDLGKLDAPDVVKMLGDNDPYRSRTALRLLSEMPLETKPWELVEDNAPHGLTFTRQAQVLMAARGWNDRASRKRIAEFDPKRHEKLNEGLDWGIRYALESGLATDKTVEGFAVVATQDHSPTVRRELASAAIRLADKHDVTPLLRALMSHKEDAKDPVIPQLVWIAYEKVLSKPRKAEAPPVGLPKPPSGLEDGTSCTILIAEDPRSSVEAELQWLAEQSPGNEFVRDQIVPKVMRRLVATGKPEDLKLCVAFVAKLKDVASLEKALGGLALALDKQQVDMPEGWGQLNLQIRLRNNPRLVPLLDKLAVSFRDPAAIKRAIEAAADVKLPVEARVEAVRQLGTLKPADATSLLIRLVHADAVLAVRVEAARSLAAFDNPTVPKLLLDEWKTHPKELRQEIVNTLSSRKEGAKRLLAAMAEKTVDRAEVTDNTILRIQAFNDKELNAAIEKAWGRTRPTPAELNKLIDKTRESLYAAPASFSRGKLVFENTCGKCHKFDAKGADVGPALEGAARDIEYILVNVLDPNRVIGAPYFVRTARLLDDTVFQGLLAEEDDKTITLKIENGALKKIKKEDLNGPVQVSEKSLMPEGLGYNLTEQNFRDLVRYLMAHPFITDVTLDGKPLSVGTPGRLLLPNTNSNVRTVEAEVTAAGEVKTRLLIGSTGNYTVQLNGKEIGGGKGAGKEIRPDRDAIDVTLPAGKHRLTIHVVDGADNVLYARFLDPDRKLSYPDAGEKK